MKNLLITDKDWLAIDEAIHVLRDRIQARAASAPEESVNEERSALAGLLSIMPKAAPTWQDGVVS